MENKTIVAVSNLLYVSKVLFFIENGFHEGSNIQKPLNPRDSEAALIQKDIQLKLLDEYCMGLSPHERSEFQLTARSLIDLLDTV
ncbi:MAG: hypothetical protein GY754_43235 [bacterium]|nr:hypothetical protein [bacterium]